MSALPLAAETAGLIEEEDPKKDSLTAVKEEDI